MQRLQPWKFSGSEISATRKHTGHYPSMRSMLKLGGSGGMPPPRKIFKIRCSEIASESIFGSKTWTVIAS